MRTISLPAIVLPSGGGVQSNCLFEARNALQVVTASVAREDVYPSTGETRPRI